MITLVLNNDMEHLIEITNFNRNTSFSNGTTYSNAQLSIVLKGNISEYLNSVADHITDIQLISADEVIYHLEDINAKITNLNEYLSDNIIIATLQIDFITDVAK